MRSWKFQVVPLLAYVGLSILLAGCNGPKEWSERLNTRVRNLATLRIRYQALQRRYEALELKYYDLEHKFQVQQSRLQWETEKKQNLAIAGHEEGRHLANISYTVPAQLTLEDKYKLAMEHVAHHKFSEAFAVFEEFLRQPESAPYQNADTLYNAGVSAFEIKNYNRARDYFEAANSHADALRDMEIIRRTKLWLKVLDRTGTRKVSSQ